MTRMPDVPAGRFVLPAGTVVYHGSRLELAGDVRARGLCRRKPAGPYGNWRSAAESTVLRQSAGIYVTGALLEAIPWADAAVTSHGGSACVWKVDASGLTAVADSRYPESPSVMVLVGRPIRPERLIGLYDGTRRKWIG
jgi:hypothetical protein